MLITSGVSFVLGANAMPHFRRGCTECSAVERQMLDQQKEAAHDMAHKGIIHSINQPDIYDCPDIRCERNKRNRPGP